jgi:hypothetical protein
VFILVTVKKEAEKIDFFKIIFAASAVKGVCSTATQRIRRSDHVFKLFPCEQWRGTLLRLVRFKGMILRDF